MSSKQTLKKNCLNLIATQIVNMPSTILKDEILNRIERKLETKMLNEFDIVVDEMIENICKGEVLYSDDKFHRLLIYIINEINFKIEENRNYCRISYI